MTRLAADAMRGFGGIELDRSAPLRFKLNGKTVEGFAGDTVLSAVLAADIDTYGTLGDMPIGLTPQFAPLVLARADSANAALALPMDRLPALDGLDLVSVGQRTGGRFARFKRTNAHNLGHRLDDAVEAPWLRDAPEATLAADLVIVGGGVAGLAAADAAATAGRKVILCERRPWLGGDARYYGAVGDEESPESVTTRLAASLSANPNVTLLTRAEAFSIHGTTLLVHQIDVTGAPRGRVVAIAGGRVLLATGTQQRLPIFAGNRLPGVIGALDAYHLAKRYGVAHGTTAIVATQSNFGYRLALRLHDAGVAVRRIADPRVNPQSRFVDFAKASGLTLGMGQIPASVRVHPHALGIGLAHVGDTGLTVHLEAAQLIVSGGLQPDLGLWTRAGGGAHWNNSRLEAEGHVENIGLAGAVAGLRSMTACVASGVAAAARLFGEEAVPVVDAEIDAAFETPDVRTMIAPATDGAPAFLDAGPSLVARPAAAAAATAPRLSLSLGDVAASVELGLVVSTDAGAIAEERGAPGGDLTASSWTPPPRAMDETPPWLAGRFGPDPVRLHLIVDGKRVFERGALVYANTSAADPILAAGVVIEAAAPGGIALLSRAVLEHTDRFVVETLSGPSPARIGPAAP